MWSSKSIMAIAETSRHRCLFNTSNTSRYSSAAAVLGNQGLTPAMKNPMSMSNVVFGMAAAAAAAFQMATFEMLFRMRRLAPGRLRFPSNQAGDCSR
jgi:hypothetical protein